MLEAEILFFFFENSSSALGYLRTHLVAEKSEREGFKISFYSVTFHTYFVIIIMFN